MVKGHKKTCKKVEKIIENYRPLMPFLWEWEGSVVPSPNKTGVECDMSMMYANYILTADIFVHESAIGLDFERLELTVLHEIAHLVFSDVRREGNMGPKWDDHEERACWRLAKSWQRLKHED